MTQCKHHWIYRKGGYEEGCIATICSICGKHGCACDFDKSIKHLSLEEQEEAREEFCKQIKGQND